MLFRTNNDDVIAIPQPSHSWLSGQLVRAWGNEAFARPAPFEEVCFEEVCLNEPATRESRKAVTPVCQWVTGAKRTGETSGTFGLRSQRRSREIALRFSLPSHDHSLCCPVSRACVIHFLPQAAGAILRR